jgi:hypothetical protein
VATSIGVTSVALMACAKDRPGRHGVLAGGDEHVDDLTELVDRPVDVPPVASHLHVGLVDLPAIAPAWRPGRAASARSGVNRSTHR